METAVTVKAAETRSMIEKKWPEICKALPRHITPERMLRVVQNALGKNPKLLECTPVSLMSSIVLASELGLEVNTPLGLAYIIPYDVSVKVGNQWKKQTTAQFQPGYKGLIELAYRSGKVKSIAAEVVYSNDEFKMTLGLHRDLIHIPKYPRGEAIGYYATVVIDGADPAFAYITRQEAYDHALRFSKAFAYDVKENKQTCPWSTNFDSQALKTAIIKVLKYAPKAIDDVNLRRVLDMENNDAIDVTHTPIEMPPVEDPRGELVESVKALIQQYNDKIPGGVTIDDIEDLIGAPISTAPIEDVRAAINDARTKAETILALLSEVPDQQFPTRPMSLDLADIEAIWQQQKGDALV